MNVDWEISANGLKKVLFQVQVYELGISVQRTSETKQFKRSVNARRGKSISKAWVKGVSRIIDCRR